MPATWPIVAVRHAPSRPVTIRRVLGAMLAALFLSGVPAEAAYTPTDTDGTWAPMEAGTRTVVLVTGGDQGYIAPQGCYGRYGGARYRPEFDAWLASRYPNVSRVWLSTGDVAPHPGEEGAKSAAKLWEHMRRVGYSAIGVGEFDLDDAGPRLLLEHRRKGLPLTSANLRVFETGGPLLPESVIVDTNEGRIGVVSVARHRPYRLWGDETTGTVFTLDPVEALKEVVPELALRVDRIILLSSMPVYPTLQVLKHVGGIDVAFASSGLALEEEQLRESEVPLFMIGSFGHGLGRLDLGDELVPVRSETVRVVGLFPIDPLTGEPAVFDPETGRPIVAPAVGASVVGKDSR